jgi:dGTPase
MDAIEGDAVSRAGRVGASSYAVDWRISAGRVVPEAPCPMRTPYQRDRDRIVHATAFRRLNYKTQVFLFHEGDHYRSRLTHSIEVAQIARALARQLRLDEDLTEALALAHDLGHPPFGHAGERALDRALARHGGFDHNAQSLKVVTKLERKYAAFDGLNLTIECLEGLVKHNGPVLVDRPQSAVLARAIADAGLTNVLDLARHASLEAQVAAIADDIAWTNHDIDDGLRAGLIAVDDLKEVPLVGALVEQALATAGNAEPRRVIYEVNRRLVTHLIGACLAEAQSRIAALAPASLEAIKAAAEPVVAFPRADAGALAELKHFLFRRVYRHARVVRVMDGAEQIVINLFARYCADASSLPQERRVLLAGVGDPERTICIGDFIAGMTDRFAIAEHRRLFATTPEL